MHLSTFLKTLMTLGLVTLTSAAALDTTTSASTSRTNSGISSTCSASTSTIMSASDSTGPQSIEEYIKAKQAEHAAAEDNNSSSSSHNNNLPLDLGFAKHVQGMKAFEVPMWCVNGCKICSSMICGKGAKGCNDWPFCSCCSTIILWDTEKDVMLDSFTTEGQTVEFQYD